MAFLENVDKAKLQKILLITISALMLAALALLLAIVIMSIEPAGPTTSDIEYKDYTVTDKDLVSGSLVLADNDNKYNYEFSEDELYVCGPYRDEHIEKDENGVKLNEYYMNAKNQMKLTKEAMVATHNMLVAAEAAVKKEDLLIAYTYGYNNADSEEFKTALMFTVTNYDGNAIDVAYTEWFDANAVSYGFVESFESAYRYVGAVHAKYMTDNKLSLVNYISYLKAETSAETVLKVKDAAGAEYAIYYVSAKAGETIKVPTEGEYTISGTNEGGVIVTVSLAK